MNNKTKAVEYKGIKTDYIDDIIINMLKHHLIKDKDIETKNYDELALYYIMLDAA